MNKIRIACLMTDWSTNEYREKHNLFGGVGYYRIHKPFTELKKTGRYEIDIYNREFKDLSNKMTGEEFWTMFVQKYDIIITKAVDNPVAAAHFCFYAKHFGTKIILDLDDNYFEVNPNQPAYQYYHPGSKKRAYFAAYLSECDGVICSTKPLAKYYHEHIKKVWNKDIPCYVMPNFNDYKEWPEYKKSKGGITIGWAGSTTHDDDLRLVMPALNTLMTEFKDLKVELLGGLTPETAPKIVKYISDENFSRLAMTGGTMAWKGYPKLLMSKKWDIGIAPLVNDEFNRGKSHIKWMEYSMAKIPCVASKTYPYCEDILDKHTIQDGITGYLAIDGLDFHRKLRTLILDEKKRKEIGENAYNYVKENWQFSQNIGILDDIINKIVNK